MSEEWGLTPYNEESTVTTYTEGTVATYTGYTAEGAEGQEQGYYDEVGNWVYYEGNEVYGYEGYEGYEVQGYEGYEGYEDNGGIPEGHVHDEVRKGRLKTCYYTVF
jgi:hypothetical protein